MTITSLLPLQAMIAENDNMRAEAEAEVLCARLELEAEKEKRKICPGISLNIFTSIYNTRCSLQVIPAADL